MTHPGFFPVRWFGINESTEVEPPFQTEEPLVSPLVAAGLADAFGASVSDEKGHIILSVLQFNGEGFENTYLEGAEVSFDVGYEVAAAQNSAAPGGFAPGTTTADGALVLINVDTGDVTATVAPPAGFSNCTLFAYNSGDGLGEYTVGVSAGMVTRFNIVCFAD